jgi:hypothetical protein
VATAPGVRLGSGKETGTDRKLGRHVAAGTQ